MFPNEKSLSNTLALSCVESYFLAWLSQFYDVVRLYSESFIPIQRVFYDFAVGAKFEEYKGVPRIQDVAERWGITEHIFCRNLSPEQALEIVYRQKEENLCLVRVNNVFLKQYKRKTRRNDHFIAIGRGLNWINQYPLSSGRFSVPEFSQCFGGSIFNFNILNLNQKPIVRCAEKICSQKFSESDIPTMSLQNLEDALGILRITRKRLEKFYNSMELAKAVLSAENKLLDKLYFDVGLAKLRKKENKSAFLEEIEAIIIKEKEFAEVVK